MSKRRTYGEDWDDYVRNSKFYAQMEPTNNQRTDLKYPGDEWGRPEEWKKFADDFLKPYMPEDGTGIAVEIGQGSGKYTLEVLEKASRVICFDVSKEFMVIAANRLNNYLHEGKVEFELLDLINCNELIDLLKEKKVVGQVDLFFSIDSMVHVELHTLFAYFLAAAKSLKIGGHLVMGVASCANDKGFQRLIDEAAWCYGGQRPSHQFFFLSKEAVQFILNKLGFKVIKLDEDRDINFVAKKVSEVAINLVGVN